MARSRKLPKENKDDAALAALKLDCVCFYDNLQNVLDSNGLVPADFHFLRNKVFPRRSDISLQRVKKWIDALTKAKKIILVRIETGEFFYCPDFHKFQTLYDDEPATFEVPYVFLRDAARQAGVLMPETLRKRRGNGTKTVPPSAFPSSSSFTPGATPEPGRQEPSVQGGNSDEISWNQAKPQAPGTWKPPTGTEAAGTFTEFESETARIGALLGVGLAGKRMAQ